MVTVLSKINAHDFRTNVEIFGWMHHFNKTRHVCTVPFLFIIFLEELVLRVLHILPRTWLFMFLKPSKPIKIEYQNSETKTKTEATNLRLNWSNPYEKKSKPINPSNPYETKTKSNPSNANQTHYQSHPHPTPSSSYIKPIKPTADQPIKPTADQPIDHHRVLKSRN